jgi:predicted amidohydrolase
MARIAIAQITSSTEKSVNLNRSGELIAEAASKRAAVIAFPEFLMAYSPATQSAEELTRLAEPLDGLFVRSLCKAAEANRIGVIATLYEPCEIRDRVYDTAVWIDPQGRVISVYRKLHLYDAFGFRESDKFAAGGDAAPPIQTAIGTSAMMICYDLRFPELARLLTLLGAEVIFAPSGWVQGDMKLEHWQTMIRARALENGCYVAAPDQVGNIYIGHSMVVDPFGRVLVDLAEREDLATVEIDPAIVREAREKLPLLQNRRADVYARYSTAGRS